MYIAGVKYVGKVTGLKQDMEVLYEVGNEDEFFERGMPHATITFGVGEIEVPVTQEQFKKLTKEL